MLLSLLGGDYTTTQSDISLPEYDSFIFDLSNDQFIPTDRSDFTHKEFGDEPGHIISPPEYDCFYFRGSPNSGELISSLNSEIRENLSSTTCVNLPVEDDYSPLLAYVVWIFLAYLTLVLAKRFHYNQVYPPQEVVEQSRMSRYYPSKDKENITGRRSQVRDLDSEEKFKTSTLGEIVSLEKSNKNVVGLRILTSIQSKHITENKSFLTDYQEIDGGFVAFGGSPKRGKIRTGKLDFEDVYFVNELKFNLSSVSQMRFDLFICKGSKGNIKTGKLDFDDVYFVKELKFNLFSVSQMCDKKNSVLFIDAECVVLSFDYTLPDENLVLLTVPREYNMYNVDLKNVVLSGGLTCLFSKATLDEYNLWHRRLGHI
nr:ribonuclease H-like domain-containing protein [Tanacetum cinerariifolium]